eukprot:3100121-Heterocapsa_arctica.AAC.1
MSRGSYPGHPRKGARTGYSRAGGCSARLGQKDVLHAAGSGGTGKGLGAGSNQDRQKRRSGQGQRQARKGPGCGRGRRPHGAR